MIKWHNTPYIPKVILVRAVTFPFTASYVSNTCSKIVEWSCLSFHFISSLLLALYWFGFRGQSHSLAESREKTACVLYVSNVYTWYEFPRGKQPTDLFLLLVTCKVQIYMSTVEINMQTINFSKPETQFFWHAVSSALVKIIIRSYAKYVCMWRRFGRYSTR